MILVPAYVSSILITVTPNMGLKSHENEISYQVTKDKHCLSMSMNAWTLSIPRSEQFFESEARGKLWAYFRAYFRAKCRLLFIHILAKHLDFFPPRREF